MLLLWDCFAVTKPLSQIQKSTLWPLQDANPTPSLGGFGFTRAKRNTKVFYLLQHLVRCTECGLLMGGSANTKKEVKRNGKLYKYELDPPRRYYRCYGYQQLRLKCRQKPMIRAERLEGLVWSEVKRVLENPDIIVAGIEALDSTENGGLAEEITTAERDLHKVQLEEERLIRLFVSGKITEDQLDHQRRYITERLETLRARLDDYRDRETAENEKRLAMEHVVQWVSRIGDGLDDLPDEGCREVLRLLLDGGCQGRCENVPAGRSKTVPLNAVEWASRFVGRWRSGSVR